MKKPIAYDREFFVKKGKKGNRRWQKDPRFKEASSRGGKLGIRIMREKMAKTLGDKSLAKNTSRG